MDKDQVHWTLIRRAGVVFGNALRVKRGDGHRRIFGVSFFIDLCE